MCIEQYVHLVNDPGHDAVRDQGTFPPVQVYSDSHFTRAEQNPTIIYLIYPQSIFPFERLVQVIQDKFSPLRKVVQDSRIMHRIRFVGDSVQHQKSHFPLQGNQR